MPTSSQSIKLPQYLVAIIFTVVFLVVSNYLIFDSGNRHVESLSTQIIEVHEPSIHGLDMILLQLQHIRFNEHLISMQADGSDREHFNSREEQEKIIEAINASTYVIRDHMAALGELNKDQEALITELYAELIDNLPEFLQQPIFFGTEVASIDLIGFDKFQRKASQLKALHEQRDDQLTIQLTANSHQFSQYLLFFDIVSLLIAAAIIIRMAMVIQRSFLQQFRFQQQYLALLEGTPGGILECDCSGAVRYSNSACFRITGHTSDQIINRPIQDFIPELQGSQALASRLQSLADKQGEGNGCETRVINTQGQEVHIQLDWRFDREESSQSEKIIFTFNDITRRVHAESEQNRLLTALDASINEIYMFNAENFVFTYVSPGARANLGFDMASLEHMTPASIKPEHTLETFAELASPLLRKEKTQIVFETVHQRADGSCYPVEVRMQLVHDLEPPQYLAIISDITARKLTDALLVESESRYRALVVDTSDNVWRMDLDHNNALSSDQPGAILGYTAEEYATLSFEQIIHPDDLAEVRARLLLLVAQKQGWQNWVLRNRCKNGSYRVLDMSASPILDPTGAITGYNGISRDVTFETLLNKITTSLLVMSLNDTLLAAAVEEWADYFAVDAFEMRWFDESREFAVLAHSWKSADTPEIPVRYRISDLRWLDGQILAGKNVRISDKANLPEEAMSGRLLMESLGVGAIVIMPLKVVGAREHVGTGAVSMYGTTRNWSDREMEELQLAFNVVAAAEAQLRSERELKARERFRALLSEISTYLLTAQLSEIDDRIHDSLEKIAKFYAIDRVGLWCFEDNNRKLHCISSWAFEGLDTRLNDILNLDIIPWASSRLLDGSMVKLDSMDDIPAEQTLDRAFYELRGVQSSLAIPLVVDHRHVGASIFANVQQLRSWSDQETYEFTLLSEAVMNAYSRSQATKAIAQSERELKESLAEVSTLKEQLLEENVYLREEIQLTHSHDQIVGESPQIKGVLNTVEKVAQTDVSVLIQGETGTGKELIARAIHDLSPRNGSSMISVNCAALSESLIESELFGHERGAFTGAVKQRKGRFELADKGSLFLDEIGELPLELQAKLLRVLQTGTFERLGGSDTMQVDVRLIAATNRDLQLSVDKGEFRADLFYRINSFPIYLPPLRERAGDIPLLTEHFIHKYARQVGREITSISPHMLRHLEERTWPGNARELESFIEYTLISGSGPVLAYEARLAEPSRGAESADLAELETSLHAAERKHIRLILEKTGWKIAGEHGAAALLGIPPSTLRSKMKKLGITNS